MSSLLDKISDDRYWKEFLIHKENCKQLPKKELNYISDFINNKKYEETVNKLKSNQYTFSIPKKIIISKMGKKTKRVVYNYNEDENFILKLLSYLMYDYDYLFSPNVYSFRKNNGVKRAIYDLTKRNNLNNLYGYKLDIHNYFNSIPVEQLLKSLKNDLQDDALYNLFDTLLSNPYVIYDNRKIVETKGIMAGVPISSFLANYYLKDLDKYFYDNKIIYARYADDIIIFANSEAEINQYRVLLRTFLNNYNLEINPDKEHFYLPGESFDFLGFSYKHGIVDLSKNTIKKIKGKIRRSARGIRRWMLKNNAKTEYAIKAMNRKYNKKFYGKSDRELSWKYWFFPTINTDKSLKEIDSYMQDYLRFIVTGKHNKKNFEKVPYDFLKQCNYKPLVHEYYLKDENLNS